MKGMRSIAAVAVLGIALSACGGGGSAVSNAGAVPSIQSGFNPSTAGIAPNLIVKDWGASQMQGATYVGPSSNAHISVNVLVHQQNAAALEQYAQSVNTPGSPNYHQWLTPQDIATRFGASQSDYVKTAQYFVSQGLAVAGWPQRMVLTVAGGQTNMQRAFGVTFGQDSRSDQTFVAPNGVPHFSVPLPVDAIGHIVAWRPDHSFMIPSPPHAASGFAAGYSAQIVRAGFDYVGAYTRGNGTGITIGIIGTGPIDTGGTSGDKDLDALAAATNLTGHVAPVTQVAVTTSGVSAGLAKSSIPTAAPGVTPNPGFPYSGDFQAPPPVTKPCTVANPPNYQACNPEDGEAQLDVQQTATLAPGAHVHFYLAYNAADCTTVSFQNQCPAGSGTSEQIGITESDPEIQQAIADDTADVISISYGGGETQQGWTSYAGTYSALEFAEMASEGMAIFASSGDSGSAECISSAGFQYLGEQCVSYPAGDPNVTSVGGITAPLDGQGNPTAAFLGWGISTGDQGYGAGASVTGASGGGISTMIGATAWQTAGLCNATPTSNYCPQKMRMQPDVSMVGDPNTGVSMVSNSQFGGTISGIGGTSVAAPEMAAMWADVLSVCKSNPSSGACANGGPGGGTGFRLGNATPYFYAIYSGKSTAAPGYGTFTPALTYAQVFYDILYGDNQMTNPNQQYGNPIPGYAAGRGYDLITGIGSPYAGHLVQAVTGLTTP
jgi:kumamolisin